RLVARELLREPEVLRRAVDGAAGVVAQRVEAHMALEAGALLPDREEVPELPRREASSEAVRIPPIVITQSTPS
ncbi:MAG TPA: hypothetical protein VI197_32335, partial [Polyangiaceae bacterium]